MLDINQFEAIVFVAGEEGVTTEILTESLGISNGEIEKLTIELQSLCESSSRPYRVIVVKHKISLVIKSQFSDIISKVRKEIEKQPLTKSHIEILAVLLYNGPSTKVDIDAYRGVNSAQAIRSLSLRGMIQKTGTSHGSSVYALSGEMLHSLGVINNEEVPDFHKMNELLKASLQLA